MKLTEKEFEAGLTEYKKNLPVGYRGSEELIAAAYYATLQERKDEGMSDSTCAHCFGTGNVAFGANQCGHCGGTGRVAVPQPCPVESVEGGLTREWMMETLGKIPGMPTDVMTTTIWSRIEAERAEWQKRVDNVTELLNDRVADINSLHAELATLATTKDEVIRAYRDAAEAYRDALVTAKDCLIQAQNEAIELSEKLANSIPMPKWEEQPTALGIGWFFSFVDEHSLRGLGSIETKNMGFIPRPAHDREMTPEEMAEAWVEWFKGNVGYTETTVGADVSAWQNLSIRLLEGKTMPQLMSEAGLKTTKKEGK